MADFRWAYINCSESSTGVMEGPLGSVQFLTGTNATSGSSEFVYHTSSNTLVLTGTLIVQGTITASSFMVDQTDVVSGSTVFGNSDDDTHIFTGSVYVGNSGSSPVFQINPTSFQTSLTSLKVKYRNVSSAGTSSTEDYIIGFGGVGAMEYRVHSASVAGSGSVLVFKDEIAGRVGGITLSASSGETIDGNTYYNISGSAPAINLYSNGTNWFVY